MRFTINSAINPMQTNGNYWLFTLCFEPNDSIAFDDFDMQVKIEEKDLIELLEAKFTEGHYITFEEIEDALSVRGEKE